MQRPLSLLPSAWFLACCVAVMPAIGDHAEAAAPSDVQPCQAVTGPAMFPSSGLTIGLEVSLPAAGTPAETGPSQGLWRWPLDHGTLTTPVLVVRLNRYLVYQALLL